MPVVRMPDGANVQFPDDMPASQIQSLIQKKFPDETSKAQAPTDFHAMFAQDPLTPWKNDPVGGAARAASATPWKNDPVAGLPPGYELDMP